MEMPDGGGNRRRSGPLPLAVLGGVVYATGVFLWAATTGVQLTTAGLLSAVVAVGYSALGLFPIAAIPLYLLGRYALIAPAAVAVWSLGHTMYLRWFVPRPHDALASYLTVWPLFVGVIVSVTILESLMRLLAGRSFGRAGLRRLR